ncbi:g4577 [Coccomyxa viridis]|uniref:G4577 protein n=1 Tax=Coccomyxa viridis TaxID=1274662 RepID=A0ABP1FQM4_9CHLO
MVDADSQPSVSGRGLNIAIEGCCHGDLDKIYSTLQHLESRQKTKIDLLICCGDFQAVRNLDDLECLACPPKYRELKSFYKYYTGQLEAPIPTLFIGGNHEAANHLWELYYGGWVAKNIFYMGHAGVINFGGARIGGLSGIYNGKHYRLGHHEHPPFDNDTMRSAYHIRELDVYRLKQLQHPLDIFLSHDWPRGIANHGNLQQLLSRKAFLRAEIADNSLGSPPAEQLMQLLRPKYWFSAHLHVKYAAMYRHQQPANGHATETAFLALDKCLPGRSFLQILQLPDAEGPKEFSYDQEWLAVLRSTHSLMSLQRRPVSLPGMGASRNGPSEEDAQYVRQALAARGGPQVPHNFAQTAPGHDGSARRGRMPQNSPRSPQTVAFLEMLGLPYNLDHKDSSQAPAGSASAGADSGAAPAAANAEEIDIDDVDDEPEDADVAGDAGDSATGQPKAEESMFAPVEIHNFNPTGGGRPEQDDDSKAMPEAIANVFRQ